MNRLDYKLRLMDNGNTKLGAAIDKSEATVRNYREGKHQPPLDVAMKISEFTGIPLTDLFDEVDEKGNKIEMEVAH